MWRVPPERKAHQRLNLPARIRPPRPTKPPTWFFCDPHPLLSLELTFRGLIFSRRASSFLPRLGRHPRRRSQRSRAGRRRLQAPAVLHQSRRQRPKGLKEGRGGARLRSRSPHPQCVNAPAPPPSHAGRHPAGLASGLAAARPSVGPSPRPSSCRRRVEGTIRQLILPVQQPPPAITTHETQSNPRRCLSSSRPAPLRLPRNPPFRRINLRLQWAAAAQPLVRRGAALLLQQRMMSLDRASGCYPRHHCCRHWRQRRRRRQRRTPHRWCGFQSRSRIRASGSRKIAFRSSSNPSRALRSPEWEGSLFLHNSRRFRRHVGLSHAPWAAVCRCCCPQAAVR